MRDALDVKEADRMKHVHDYEIRHNTLSAEEFKLLWESVRGQPLTIEQARLAIENTLYSVSMYDGDTIIAMARVIEDNGLCYYYDATAEQDAVIIGRVAELAEKHGVTMTEVSLAWLLTKVTSPVVGATKLHHIEGAAKAVDIELTDNELKYLEEPYVPHPLAGVMAQNKRSDASKKHVWSTGDQKIGK